MFGKLLFLFIAIPIAELYLFMTLGKEIGLPLTLLIIVATAVIGAWLTRMQGARAMARFQQATAEGRLPHEEVLDGVMILIAGDIDLENISKLSDGMDIDGLEHLEDMDQDKKKGDKATAH